MKCDYLEPTATCEAPIYMCGWGKTCKSYNEAVIEGSKHNKETGHVVRAEQIRTTLIGWENQK